MHNKVPKFHYSTPIKPKSIILYRSNDLININTKDDISLQISKALNDDSLGGLTEDLCSSKNNKSDFSSEKNSCIHTTSTKKVDADVNYSLKNHENDEIKSCEKENNKNSELSKSQSAEYKNKTYSQVSHEQKSVSNHFIDNKTTSCITNNKNTEPSNLLDYNLNNEKIKQKNDSLINLTNNYEKIKQKNDSSINLTNKYEKILSTQNKQITLPKYEIIDIKQKEENLYRTTFRKNQKNPHSSKSKKINNTSTARCKILLYLDKLFCENQKHKLKNKYLRKENCKINLELKKLRETCIDLQHEKKESVAKIIKLQAEFEERNKEYEIVKDKNISEMRIYKENIEHLNKQNKNLKDNIKAYIDEIYAFCKKALDFTGSCSHIINNINVSKVIHASQTLIEMRYKKVVCNLDVNNIYLQINDMANKLNQFLDFIAKNKEEHKFKYKCFVDNEKYLSEKVLQVKEQLKSKDMKIIKLKNKIKKYKTKFIIKKQTNSIELSFSRIKSFPSESDVWDCFK